MCKKKEREEEEEEEDNSSTEQGHLRSVYSVLTSCSFYPVFIHSFHSSNSRRSTDKISTQSLSLCGMREYDEICTVSVNTRGPEYFFKCCDSAVLSIFRLMAPAAPSDGPFFLCFKVTMSIIYPLLLTITSLLLILFAKCCNFFAHSLSVFCSIQMLSLTEAAAVCGVCGRV